MDNTKTKPFTPGVDAYHGQGGSYVRQPGSSARQRVLAPVGKPLPATPKPAPFADFPLSAAGRASTTKPQE